jgi:hypothetical protein
MFKNLTDGEITTQHRAAERIANILHQGIKNGIKLPFWIELHNRVIEYLQNLNEAYFQQHPEAKEKQLRMFLAFADTLIDQNNKDLFGDNDKYEQHIMIEYHKPNPDMKTVTIDFRKEPDSPAEHIVTEMKMTSKLDFLKANLETALDAIAKYLPDVPAEK